MNRYVGRERELAAVGSALEAALTGHGQIVVVSGEAGIGKTRLLAEVQRLAGDVPVHWGRAVDAEGAPPYWPWRQVLRAAAGANASVDGSLLSLIATPGAPTAATGGDELEAGDARFWLFDAVSRRLREHASARGAVYVLDDLHWADTPSLRLLEHVAQEWQGTRALLVAAYRSGPLQRDSPLRQTLAQLARLDITTRLELSGFSREEMAARLRDLTGRDLPEDAVRRLHDRTSGNPFFVTELGHLIEHDPSGAEDGIPQGVRDVISRHVGRLTPTCQEVLEIAAVAGAQPSPALLAAALETSLADVLQRFDEAAAAGLLTSAPDRVHYAFTHALVRDALYSELSAAQRMSWHARIATELERTPGAERDAVLSQLAYHWQQAIPMGHTARAASSLTAAAAAALTQLAYEEAGRLYESAADVRVTADAAERARLLVRAARARFLAGELEPALDLCEQTARVARGAGAVELIGEAALVLEGVGDATVSAAIAELCDEALAGLPASATQMRSRLLAQLASTRLFAGTGGYAELEPLSRQALEIADQTGDYETLVPALRARHTARSDAAGLEERILLAERLLELAQGARNRVDEFWARNWRFDIALQLGRLDDADTEIGRVAVLAGLLRLPLAFWHLERMRFAAAHARGDFAAARRAAAGGDSYARSAGQLARYRSLTQEVILAVLTGDDSSAAEATLAEVEERTSAGPMPTWIVMHRLTLGAMALSRGDVPAARQLYDGTPGPLTWSVMPPATLVALSLRAELGAELGGREERAIVYQLLLPHADLCAAAGSGAVASFGSIERPLGMLARALGRTDTALRHLERAVARNEEAGMRPWAAQSRFELASTLHERAVDGDIARALPVAAQAAAAAEALGMRPLARRATDLHEALRSGTRGMRVLTPREMEIARMVAEGLTSREIAEAMHISSRTADNHVQHILDKLDLRSRNQIAAWVARSPARTATET